MKSFLIKAKRPFFVLILVLGCTISCFLLLLAEIRRYIYEYDYDYATQLLNGIFGAGKVLLILLSLVCVISAIFYLKRREWKTSLVTVVCCLVFGLAVYKCEIMSVHTTYSLIDPVVVSKDQTECTVTVQASNFNEEITFRVTNAEYALITVGEQYVSMIYDLYDGLETGVLLYVEAMP